MFSKLLGCVALATVAFAMPALAQETNDGPCSADGLKFATGYALPKLGIDISTDPNVSAWGSCQVSDTVVLNAWGSSDLPINDDGVNQGLEIDLYGVASFGSLDVTFGTYLYPEIDESDLVLGFAFDIGGFAFEANRYEGFSDTTSLGVMAPAVKLGDVELSFGLFHNIDPVQDYQSLPIQIAFPLGKHATLAAVGFLRSDDEQGGVIELTFHK